MKGRHRHSLQLQQMVGVNFIADAIVISLPMGIFFIEFSDLPMSSCLFICLSSVCLFVCLYTALYANMDKCLLIIMLSILITILL